MTIVRKSLHDHWYLYVAEGIVLIFLGADAFIVPFMASVAVAFFLGWLFLIGGGFSFGMNLMSYRAPGFWWSLLSALATIAVGALLVGWPIGGVISITFILTAFLILDGVLKIFFAIEHRQQFSRRWGWLLVSGLLNLGLAGIIVWALPQSATWALGVIVGIYMLFGGGALVAMALAAHEENPLAS